MTSRSRSGWWIPASLVILCAIPVVAGVARVVSLARGGPVTAESARFFAAPWPVVAHVAGAIVLVLVGAFQLAPGFRRRHPRWHRRAGRWATAAGLVASFSGLWMSVFYPPGKDDGRLLLVFRLFFGTAMAVCLTLGFVAARRAEVPRHRAWMSRGYAIGAGAGTQAVLHLPFVAARSMPGVLGRALLMALGWCLNLAVAEWLLRRQRPLAPAGRALLPTEERPARAETLPRTCSDLRTPLAAPLRSR
jgi:hypothetical protein